MEGSAERRGPHSATSESNGRPPDPGQPFRRIVESGADGVVVLDPSGAIVYANPSACAMLGRPLTELLGRPLGRPVVPSRAAEIDVPTPGGAARVVELRSAEGVWDGRPALLIGLRDVTAYRLLADGQRFLAEAGAELARSLDLPETLARIARLVVREVADACLIDLLQPDGSLLRPIARHAQTQPDALLSTLRGCPAIDPAGSAGLPRALRTGRPKLYSRATDAALDSLAGAPEQRALIRGLGVGSIMIHPLVARGRILGALTLLTTRTGHFLSATDLPTAGELATIAALALDNALLFDDARAAVRRRDEFLAMLSHELRNPLASIVHASALLGADGGLGPSSTGAVEVVTRQAEQMSRLLDDLLDISRVTRGIIQLDRSLVDLLDVVERSLEAARPAIEAGRHCLHLDLAAGPLLIEGDPARLTQVLVNLLTNAARYTPEGGNIRLQVKVDPVATEIIVQDDGIGIEPELLPQIFDLFTQGTRGLDRSQGGLGIGLTLVKEIVELHDGSISASSDGPGLGSAFRVRLAPPSSGEEIGREPPTVERSVEPEVGAIRILIVEDHDDNRRMLQTLLTLHGHRVEGVPDGRAALKALRQRPDLALIDIGLPEIDGLTLARTVRADPELRDLILIAVTGYARPEDRAEALAAGFNAHLSKPVRIEELNRLIQRHGRPSGPPPAEPNPGS